MTDPEYIINLKNLIIKLNKLDPMDPYLVADYELVMKAIRQLNTSWRYGHPEYD